MYPSDFGFFERPYLTHFKKWFILSGMNRRVINPVNPGDIFNNFTVLDERAVKRGITSVRSERQLLCRCVCGKEKWYPKSNIVCGTIKSCGCVSRIKHGQWHTRLYNIWYGMLRRCCVTHDKAYPLYGGRGITVCNEWKNDFFKFKEWAENNGYNDSLTIDRINVDGNYCPDNCRWVSMKEQQNNRRNNHYVVWQGKKYSVTQLAELHGIKGSLLSERLRKGEPLETALVAEDRRGKSKRRKKTDPFAKGEIRPLKWLD